MTAAWGELDHIMLFCEAGAPEADALKERGFHEGPGNTHPGQGTANRRFFFRGAYLELVWVENFEEAQSPEARPTGILERWLARKNGACPFGLVFRPGKQSLPQEPPSWTYKPRYFPPGFSIQVASDVPLNEPMLVYIPFARASLVEELDPATALTSIGTIIGVRASLPGTQVPSVALTAVATGNSVALEPAREYLLDVIHVGGTREIIDLRPHLPLRFVPADRRSPRTH